MLNPGPGAVVRPADPRDLPALAELCAAHAAFEKAAPPPADLADRLASALFGPAPRAHCLVVAAGSELIGYASCSLEFSTWRAACFLHLDCLFVSEPHRGEGWGRRLIEQAVAVAATLGATHLEWQTPDWNSDAIAFYRRLGATPHPKIRFTFHPDPAPR